MKKQLLFFSLLLSIFSPLMAEEKVENELFFLGLGTSVPLEDKTAGINFRAGFPMQKGFYFIAQASYLPTTENFKYKEFRYEFNIELNLISLKKFTLYANAGLNFGFWQRTYATPFLPIYNGWRLDNSILVGGGLLYDLPRFQIFSDYKLYPEIKRNYISLGFKYKIFRSKELRQQYYLYRKNKKAKTSQ